MLPFWVAEAVRRARHAHRVRSPGSGPGVSTWRLVRGEVAHLTWVAVASPAAAVVLAGLVASAGVWVALGPGYPGPVAPDLARWLLVAVVLSAALGVALTAPSRWRDVRRAVRRARIGLVAVAAAAAVSLVKVGLHEMTPGPVMSGTARWIVVAAIAVVAVVLVADRDRRSGS